MCTQENVDQYKQVFNKSYNFLIKGLYDKINNTFSNPQEYIDSIDRVEFEIDINPENHEDGSTPLIYNGYIFNGCGNLSIDIFIKGDDKNTIASDILSHTEDLIFDWLDTDFFKFIAIDMYLDFADIILNIYGDDEKFYGDYIEEYEELDFDKAERRGSWILSDNHQ